MEQRRPRWTAALGAGALGALGGGLSEAAFMAARASLPSWSAAAAVLGAWLPLWLPLCAAHVVVRRGWLAGEPSPTARRAAVLRLAWAGAALAVSVGVGAGFVARQIADLRLLGPLVAVGVLAAVATLALAWRLSQRALDPPTRWGAQSWGRAAPLALAPLLGVAAWVAWAALRDISVLPITLPLGALALSLLAPDRAARRLVLAAPLLLAAGPLGWALYAGSDAVRQAVQETEGVALRVVGVVAGWGDGDGDGVSRWLGGGDCDDGDSSVHPLAADIPGNGVDEDCDGEDADPRVVKRDRVARVARPPALNRRWNVLLITVDALRPDHLSLFGHPRPTSPHIDALAASGLVFHRAYSAANSTRHAVPPLLASRALDDMHMERKSTSLLVLPGNDLLFERLSDHGYYTEVHVDAYLQRRAWFGLEQGVERFVGHAEMDLRAPLSGPVLVDAFRDLLDRPEALVDARPWAAWLHFEEPHEPYFTHPNHDFGDAPEDRYDSEIAAVDALVGELVEALHDRRLAESTIIVLTSDHGEEFGEHGKQFHGKQLFDESVRVPLIIHVPGQPRVDVQAPVSTIDVTETLANLVGARGGLDYGAVSHVARLVDPARPEDWQRAVYVDAIHHDDRPRQRQVALIEWPYKLIVDFRSGSMRLFDLARDPGERRDLSRAKAGVKDQLAAKVRARVQRQARDTVAQLIAARVSREAPADAEPVTLAPGLEWLGAELRPLDDGWYEVEISYRATADRRPDYQLEVQWRDGKRPLRTRRARPLAGRLPTHRWAQGDVVVDVARANLPNVRGPLSVHLSVYQGRRDRVFGPQEVARQPKRQPGN